ncbi:MMPL family transporter [Gracilibacillus sp. S3-1-1]|uniref:MMPL family transporter n=1 Tax=Gracilibacillus pellucidus TaxID=3095368 RepID=A0ACC6M439_9BACI|nr:MMPL family transporter [Gracilibacillus sp. S3-1-1]MDX8045587.1 MMPL family transporter [Gracilibacillus sp. S3-1-1]
MHRITEIYANKMYQFRWIIVSVWTVCIIASGIFALQLSDLLTGGGWNDPEADSTTAYQVMIDQVEGRQDSSLTLVVTHDEHQVGSAAYTETLQSISQLLQKEETIELVETWDSVSTEMQSQFIGDDPHTSIGFIGMNIDEGFAQKVLPDIQERLVELVEPLGFQVFLLGAPAFWGETTKLSQEGLELAHLYALPIIVLVLLFVFRSFISSLMPLILAAYSIVASLGFLFFIAEQTELSVFILDATLMLGIGVGIDFSLIFIQRFKEELNRQNGELLNALTSTLKHAGHAILFSSITIIGSMAAILFTDIAAVRSIAMGVMTVVFFLMIATLTLLPALLLIIGHRINNLQLPFFKKKMAQPTESIWYRLSHKVMRRPIAYLLGTGLFLMVIAIPAVDLEVSTPDSRMLPEDTQIRQGIEHLQDSFGVGYASPIHVVIQSDDEPLTTEANLSFLENLTEKLTQLENVENVSSFLSFFPDMELETISMMMTEEKETFPDDVSRMLDRSLSNQEKVAVMDVITNDYSSSETNRQIVHEIRQWIAKDNSPFHLYVGGETAVGIDTSSSLNKALIHVLTFTLLLIFVILMITFKSVVLPIKAIILNTLSLAATYGVLVAVFQYGWGAELLGFGDFGFMQSFIPILLLGLLFSLSTDYEVFLLTRIKEEYQAGKNNEESVALGVAQTAPLISGAALIMITVFASFAFAGVLPMQQLGLGMAVAIAIDATIVRLLLVPATMKLLGNWNWWFPGKKYH